MSDSGAPASTSAAETTSVRGVAFGWAKVAVSMTMPAIRSAASAPSSASSGDAEPAGEQRRPSRTSPRLPGRSSRRRSARVVRGVVVDDDPRQPLEQLGMAGADLADPLERAAVGDDQQVVGARRVGVGPEALDARR